MVRAYIQCTLGLVLLTLLEVGPAGTLRTKAAMVWFPPPFPTIRPQSSGADIIRVVQYSGGMAYKGNITMVYESEEDECTGALMLPGQNLWNR